MGDIAGHAALIELCCRCAPSIRDEELEIAGDC